MTPVAAHPQVLMEHIAKDLAALGQASVRKDAAALQSRDMVALQVGACPVQVGVEGLGPPSRPHRQALREATPCKVW